MEKLSEGLREPIAGSQRGGGLESSAEDEAQVHVLHHHFAAVESGGMLRCLPAEVAAGDTA